MLDFIRSLKLLDKRKSMSQLIHILNGDSTAGAFKSQHIPGEVIVWREVLCEGPADPEVGSPTFWMGRRRFFSSFFLVETRDYDTKTVSEFEKLSLALKNADEIVLWFEYDLFCQINMIAILSWLNSRPLRGKSISLICTGHFPGYDKMVGLGELDPLHYPILFEERQQLTKQDLFFASVLWKTYCSDDHRELLPLAETAPPAFQYLEEALRAHYQRFPSYGNGLNEIQRFIIGLLATGPQTERELIGQLLQRPNFYGIGDQQYARYIEHLSPLYNRGEKLELNDLGIQVANDEANFIFHTHHIYRFGGADSTMYRWIPGEDSLAKVEVL